MTNQQIITIAREAGVSNHIISAALRADELMLKDNQVWCLFNSPHECDFSFQIPTK